MRASYVCFRLILIMVMAASLGAMLGPGQPAQAALSTTHAPKIAWSPCFQQFGPYECGTVQVPLDYAHPNGATISIAVIRLPATDPAQRIGSLFFNPGGPGGSGVEFVLGAGPYMYTDEVRAKFDMVGFDPRGIARSTALRCFGTPKQWTPYFTPFGFPMTPEEEEIWITADRYLDDACEQRGFKIIDYMNTANVARDLDMLREAVGDEMLNYAGYSYGSFLGQVYANLFPDKVRAVVIDGVLDPIAWTTGLPGQEMLPFSTRLRSDKGAMDTLNEFFRLCDENPGTCAFASAIPSAERFAALAETLKANPLPLPQPDGSVYFFTYQDLIGNTLGAMYDSFSWPSNAEFLNAIASMAEPAVVMAKLEAFQQDAGLIAKRGFPRYPNYIEGFPAVACGDSDNPVDYAAWSAAGIQADLDYGYFGRLWTWTSAICAEWPGGQVGRYAGPFTGATANPVLVVGNFFDPATRYEGAQTAAALLPNSRLLSMNGWGHVSIFLSQCADQYVSDYIVSGALPPEGTVCSQDLVPFVDITSFAQAGAAGEARHSIVPVNIPEAIKGKK